ncbi:hypothetical protein [Serratia fonticola]|uniref:Uncharacterized protein n=1 Tax=Serratia fonticola TaxID=47917 RepID=A0ABY9PUT7_SERFO|nr:hypothetical protein [Serratia fonticola]WMT17216.1 hypothetical protein RFB13_13230 [Serratia fonticola]WMT17225.1 hypothetical protein RFB13_13275 [Serratia fonticola]
MSEFMSVYTKGKFYGVLKMAKRATYNVTEERKLRLERLAIDTSVKIGKTVTWTEIIGFLIDNYAKDAADDLTAKGLIEFDKEMALEMNEAEMVGGRGPLRAKINQPKAK